MQAPLHTPRSNPAEDLNRRRVQRVVESTTANLLTAGRAPCPATLTDISRHGCCAETTADWLTPGRFVAIALPGRAPIESIVRWSRNGMAGLELLSPTAADHAGWLALIH